MGAVWENRLAEMVKALASRRESTQLELVPDLLPVLPLIDAADMEYAYLRGERHFAAMFSVGPVAGQFSTVFLVNAGDSQRIIRVLRAALVPSLAAAVSVHIDRSTTVGAGGSVYSVPRDPRMLAGAFLQGRVTWETLAAVLPAPTSDVVAFRQLVNTQSLDMPMEYVLGPGCRMRICCRVANAALNGHIEWEERDLTTTDELIRR